VNFRVASAFLFLATALLLVSACLLPAADTAAGNWIDVPYVAQPKDGCGAAVISMLMQYWLRQPSKDGQQPETSASADPRKIQELLFVPAEKGIPASAMLRYFEQSGYRVFAFRGEWNDLQHHVSQGRPLIVSLKASGPRGPLHYAVVAGVDSQRNYVFLNDPARGKMLRVSREGFLGEWNPANNWTLLAVPATRD
jgi:predicted double-glycine peptidase